MFLLTSNVDRTLKVISIYCRKAYFENKSILPSVGQFKANVKAQLQISAYGLQTRTILSYALVTANEVMFFGFFFKALYGCFTDVCCKVTDVTILCCFAKIIL